VTKQATIPEGAVSLGLAGTAPGLVVPHNGGRVAVVLPGPPSELRRLWPRALDTAAFRALLERTTPPERHVMKFFGVSESAVAQALEAAGGDGDGVEVTICARDFEIHVDLVVEPEAEARANELSTRFVEPIRQYLWARDESTIEQCVLDLCHGRGLTLATAESCTGGLVAARLTGIPGSSRVFRGGVVAYSDEVKRSELGVSPELLERHGAVSPEVAAAMARGARARLGADVAVSVTGVAGPGGGTPAKPVGLVYLHVEGPDGGRGREFSFPGDRASIRARSVVGALHLVRRLLTGTRDESV
jgi:nicotinamide-nucleotide amidase